MIRLFFTAILLIVATIKSVAQDSPQVTASGTYFEKSESTADYKGWSNSNGTNETRASYKQYNGTTYVLIKSPKDVKLSLKCIAEVKKGSLEVLLEEDASSPGLLYAFNKTGSAEKYISLKAGIQYKIKFKGQNTQGSYKCSWSTL
ncbi:hypothetical protein [Flavobacterium psychrotrophum]|uniref:hypothetical protein n=1 Tax=Flavobacterium psychrotrophum TaxID=2294119 RepID=UPI000E30EC02|nr:hypothetical protein [Flavobacterium psychrotrophum]